MTNESDNKTLESGRGDYEVGYKKPPRHTQFRKGKSGNPAGRPKRAVNVQASLHKTLSRADALSASDGKPKKMSTWDAGLAEPNDEHAQGRSEGDLRRFSR